jgi:nucleoside-diphosphate-sugar epimerase
MRIFVTGGTGFIGRYTVAELKKRGHDLLVLSRSAHRERGIEFVKGDMTDLAKWGPKVKKFKPEDCVHLAWEGIPDLSYERSIKNLADGLALYGFLAEIGCKRIISTGSGFEVGSKVGKIAHDIPVEIQSVFTAAKHSLHLLGNQLAREKGTEFVWLRPFNPYGDGQRSGSLMPFIMKTVADNIPLTLRKPLAQGDFLYITDAANAFADAVTRGKPGETYNVGCGYLTPVRDIALMIAEEMGADKPYRDAFWKSAKGKLSPGPYAEIDNAKKDMGWRPKVSIREGIRKTVQDYKKSLKQKN